MVDDASTDDSLHIIERLAEDNHIIRLERNETNRGALYSFDRGLRLASGDYVYAAGADDRVLPGLFEKSLRLLSEFPNAGLCSALAWIEGDEGRDRGVSQVPLIARKPDYHSPGAVESLLRRGGSWFAGNTVIYRRLAAVEAGGYLPELKSYTDHFLSLVVALRYGACFIPEPLGVYRSSESGYNAAIMGDLRATSEIIDTIQRLMRSTYADTFSPACTAHLISDFRYFAAKAVIESRLREEEQLLETIDAWLGRGHWMGHRLVIAGLSQTAHMRGLIERLYLYVRLRRPTWRSVGSRIAQQIIGPRDSES